MYTHNGSLIDEQVSFHEDFWSGADDEALQEERLALGVMVDRFKRFLPSGGGPILDVGCGRGSLVAALRDRGYAATGVDASPVLIETARAAYDLPAEVAITNDAFSYLAETDEKFGAMFLWHVLEHVDYPERLLTLCRERLAPGGFLLVQLPTLHPAWVYREHLMLATPFTARVLARLTACELAWAGYDSNFSFLTIVLRNAVTPSSAGIVDQIDASSSTLAALQALYLSAVGTTPRAVVGRR